MDDYVTSGAAKPHVPGAPDTDELAVRRAQAAQSLKMKRGVDKHRQIRTKPDQEDDAGYCKVHHRYLSGPEFDDGGCSWCEDASAAAEVFMGMPAAIGGGES